MSLIHHAIRQLFPGRKILLFFFLILFCQRGYSQALVRLNDIRTVPTSGGKPVRDSGNEEYKHIEAFKKFVWDATGVRKKAAPVHFVTGRPDTIDFNKADTIFLTTAFAVAPQLTNQLVALNFRIDGSLSVKLNGIAILETGAFAKNEKDKLHKLKQDDDYRPFLFKDTTEKMDVVYIPASKEKTLDADLQFKPVDIAEKERNDNMDHTNRSLAIGFYYLAFGVVFLILFLFFREKTENLHFALFCIFVALTCLWDFIGSNILYDFQEMFFIVFAFEFLSMFFPKILRNKEKTKISLAIISFLFAVSFLPFIRHSLSGFHGISTIVGGTILGLVVMYAAGSSIYFLIEGFGQKQWEARAIVYIFTGSALVCFLMPIIVSAIMDDPDAFINSPISKLPRAGLYILPLSAAIALGRRNAVNQKQLIAQISSIKKLSEENLEKEKEKKQILENQKEVLEQEVATRTAEVVLQKEEIEKQHGELKVEKKKSDDLLRNILPEEVAEELKETGRSEARFFNDVTVLFTDFVNFTQAVENMSPQALIGELHTCYKAFDEIMVRHNIEKIKTIGDAYFAVAGLPLPDPRHAEHVVMAAKEIRSFVEDRFARLGSKTFEIRIGVHSGSVVAGIVGVKKFAYDIWGDTVNTAARMEQNSEIGKINLSQTTYDLVKDKIECEYRGEIDAKNKGRLKMYYVK